MCTRSVKNGLNTQKYYQQIQISTTLLPLKGIRKCRGSLSKREEKKVKESPVT
jgi:hypothetical protein